MKKLKRFIIELMIKLFKKSKKAFVIYTYLIVTVFFMLLTYLCALITNANLPGYFVLTYILFMSFATTRTLYYRVNEILKGRRNIVYCED